MSQPQNWLPFHELTNSDFNNYINDLCYQENNLSISHLNELKFNQILLDDDKYNDESDPDLNHFSHLTELTNSCEYFFPDSFEVIENKFYFSLINLNINSIPKNFNHLITCFLDVVQYKFDILSFCETKLSDDISDLYELDGYKMYTSNISRHRGGLALYIKDIYTNFTLQRNDLERKFDYLSSLFVEIENEEEKRLIGVLYRSPNSDVNNFLTEFEIIIEKLQNEKKNVYLMGDLNLNLLNNDKNVKIRNLISILHSNNFLNTITKPTRVMGTSATLIDHIWTNNYLNCIKNGIFYEHISDHFPIFSIFEITRKKEKYKQNEYKEINFRKLKDDNNIRNICNDLQEVDWSLVLNTNNPNVAYDNFILIFQTLFKKNFPIITKKIKIKSHEKPYITAEIKEIIKEKHKLQKLSSKWPISYGKKFKDIRNKLTETIRIAKCTYYKKKLVECAGDSSGTWKILNTVMNKKVNNSNNQSKVKLANKIITKASEISEAFNIHFAEIGRNLSKEISENGIDPLGFLSENISCKFQLTNTNEKEILNIVAELKDVTGGFDEIPMLIIKKTIKYIVIPLKHIYNSSFNSGIFPDKLKISKIIPIFKHGEKSDINNYRPISILPCFSKIIEKLINIRLETYLEANNILNHSQHGFRRKRSTTSAIMELNDFVLEAFDRKEFTIGLFLDFKKAFDCVDHNILIKKLRHYGISDTPLKLFESYLSNRKQYTHYMNTNSLPKVLTHSVPQGSILGPILFNIYINDINKCVKSLKAILFADDSCFLKSDKSTESLIKQINNELKNINSWLTSNKLTLNILKSHYIIFKRKLTLPLTLEPIIINTKTLNKVSETKFLGITIQDNLKWHKHINIIANKVNKYSSIIYQIRDLLDKNCLKLIYNSLVYSILTYVNIIWGNSPITAMKPLVTAQKKIIRTIKYRKRYHPTNNDFYTLKILKIKDINKYFSSIFVYKVINDLNYPNNYFNITGNTLNYNLRNATNLRPPKMNSNQSQGSPAYYCCEIWNTLPPYIRLKPSVASFKFSIKNTLINNYKEP